MACSSGKTRLVRGPARHPRGPPNISPAQPGPSPRRLFFLKNKAQSPGQADQKYQYEARLDDLVGEERSSAALRMTAATEAETWLSNKSAEMTSQEEVTSSNGSVIKMWMILVGITITGIVLNLGILIRRKFNSKRSSSSTTRSSLFLLAAMAAADTLCLFSLLFLLCLRFFKLEDPLFLTLVCKLDVFVMHTTSSFSIWCWLVLSAVRYMAVYRPYTHLRLDREPRFAVITVAVFCCLSEAWVLWDIAYDDESKSCGGPETEISRHFQIFEIIISYFLPVAFITILDIKVLLCRAVWFSHVTHKPSNVARDSVTNASIREKEATPTASGNTSRPPSLDHKLSVTLLNSNLSFMEVSLSRSRSKKRQQMRVLRRCLCITIFDLSMNLPSYLLRLYLAITPKDEVTNWELIFIVEEISQVMYFAQFALNAVYLVCIIYDTPRKKCTVGDFCPFWMIQKIIERAGHSTELRSDASTLQFQEIAQIFNQRKL
ncbi:unnamed protein product [Caenorhabditis auriculariae]|uniref:G-protein coupled receptors family 1 profile domain-containing protein n=1 Tax=Caenorhabditis auriculariae TaxID=2777116 RepID=A0A8S1HAU9_9PELO|nr:unnamed protein product [Caenorhabditis auriculariae]